MDHSLTEILSVKVCPFCDNDEMLLLKTNGEWSVHCKECGAHGPKRDSERKCIYSWNIRKQEARVISYAPDASTVTVCLNGKIYEYDITR